VPADLTASEGMSARLRGNSLWLLCVLFLLPMIGYVHRLMINILIDPVSAELALSDTQASFLQGPPFALAYGLMVIPMGLLVDRRQRTLLLSAGALIWSAGTFFCGFAGDFNQLFAARLIVGIGEAALTPATVSLIGDAFIGPRRGLAMGVFFTGINAGFSTAYAVGGAALEMAQANQFSALPWVGDLAPWRQVFCVLAVPGFLIPLLMFTIREPEREPESSNFGQHLSRSLFRQPGFSLVLVMLVIAASLLAVADNGVYAWLPRLLSRLYELKPTEIGVSLGIVVALGGLVGGPLGGVANDFFFRRKGTSGPLFTVLAGCALALAALPLYASKVLPMVYLATGLWVVAVVAATSSIFTFIAVAAPVHLRGTASSVVTAAVALIGLGLGPTTIAVVLEQLSFARERVDLAILVSALPLCLVAAGLAFLALHVHQRFDKSVAPLTHKDLAL
jgi:MFS family permease